MAMHIRIKKGTGEAAYRQIEQALSRAILDGELKEGEQLPSEVELAHRLGLSRMTVNKALTALSRRGLIWRSRGKGSYVTPQKLHQGFFKVTSFNRYISSLGMVPSTRVLESTVQPATREIATALDLREGARVIKVRRLRLADGIPLMLETRYLNYSLCRPVLEEDLGTGSIHDILIKKLNLPLTRVKQFLEVRRIGEKNAALLGIEPGACCFYMIRTTYTHERPITWVHYLYRSDRYRFEADFNPMENVVGE